jgi:hypothetical protein
LSNKDLYSLQAFRRPLDYSTDQFRLQIDSHLKKSLVFGIKSEDN